MWVWRWPTHSYTTQHSPPSVDPYDVPSDKAPPVYVPFMPRVMPWVEHPPRAIVVPWITASRWHTARNEFIVVADLAPVLKEHGPGVYSIMVWASVGGARAPVSQYSIFHEVQPPGEYDK